ncbi:hypothetical protein J5N97_009591 [Dioscorea zingiberensis]|uniref:Uncharacterized protein n=1 Tax=Dioscorea zingiberensis TaxID=325984 RepID=A0A9D5CX57_9LILI|nr:hypothetical protein J5N97_009591 [Dioscorea zingiberensis]
MLEPGHHVSAGGATEVVEEGDVMIIGCSRSFPPARGACVWEPALVGTSRGDGDVLPVVRETLPQDHTSYTSGDATGATASPGGLPCPNIGIELSPLSKRLLANRLLSLKSSIGQFLDHIARRLHSEAEEEEATRDLLNSLKSKVVDLKKLVVEFQEALAHAEKDQDNWKEDCEASKQLCIDLETRVELLLGEKEAIANELAATRKLMKTLQRK